MLTYLTAAILAEMRHATMPATLLVASILLMLITASCGGNDLSQTNTITPTPQPFPYSVLEFNFNKTHNFASMGFSMTYPEGWLTGVSFRTTLISELNEDHVKGFPNVPGIPRPTKGYQVTLTVVSKDVYLKRSAQNLDALMGMWASSYSLKAQDELIEAQMFLEAPALRLTGTMGIGRRVNCLVGHTVKYAYLFCLGAPTEQALTEFMPSWERMLASIKPVGE